MTSNHQKDQSKILTDRKFLFLQGPSSKFFSKLAHELRGRGATVTGVIFCPGDWLFWSGAAIHFRHKPAGWTNFLKNILEQHAITDIVCLGDGRFWHKTAIEIIANDHPDIRINIVELGYLRPDWLTVETEGTGGNSDVPTKFKAETNTPEAKSEPTHAGYHSSFIQYAAFDVAYHLANILFGWILFPHYRSLALHNPIQEWRGWIKKAVLKPLRNRKANRIGKYLEAFEGQMFLFPLQLETDYQIRQHGTDEGIRTTLARIVESFANHAPKNAVLLVKIHPLDNGLTPWQAMMLAAAKEHNCTDRCHYLDGGVLEQLLERAQGVVTINSTVGLTALRAGVPVKVLGRAIYNAVGITDQQPLQRFWKNPKNPDKTQVSHFVDMLIRTVQVRGGFIGQGISDGVRNVANKLT